jgi:hypothetical protein
MVGMQMRQKHLGQIPPWHARLGQSNRAATPGIEQQPLGSGLDQGARTHALCAQRR